MNRRVLLVVLSVILVVGGIVTVAHAATQNISCPATVSDTAAQYTVTTTCKFPKPPPTTVTVRTTTTATVTVTPTPTPTATPTPTPTQPPTGGFPAENNTGLPAGWTPTQTVNGLTVTTAGAVVQDLRINGDLLIAAPNVTVRRVDVVGGSIDNWPGATCQNGLTISDSRVSTGTAGDGGFPAVNSGGYTASNVLIVNSTEGFRVGGMSGGCGPVTVTNSYAHIIPPDGCGDWHGDGIQGYDGAKLTVRNTVLWLDERGGCGGTAPFFYPDQGNTSVDVDGLIVRGGGFPFRLETPGTVRNLHIVNNSWGYGPIDVICSKVTVWQASISNLDANGQPVIVRAQPC